MPAQSVKGQARDIVKKTLRDVAAEPFEIVKTAQGQIGVLPEVQNQPEAGVGQNQVSLDQNKDDVGSGAGLSQKDKLKSQRLIEALETEIKDIRRQKQEKKLEEEEPLKQKRLQEEQVLQKRPLPGVPTKPKRGILGGVAGWLSKKQRSSETRGARRID